MALPVSLVSFLPRLPCARHAEIPGGHSLWGTHAEDRRRSPIKGSPASPTLLLPSAAATPNPSATALASLRRAAPLRRCCHAVPTHRSSGQAAQKHRPDVPSFPKPSTPRSRPHKCRISPTTSPPVRGSATPFSRRHWCSGRPEPRCPFAVPERTSSTHPQTRRCPAAIHPRAPFLAAADLRRRTPCTTSTPDSNLGEARTDLISLLR